MVCVTGGVIIILYLIFIHISVREPERWRLQSRQRRSRGIPSQRTKRDKRDSDPDMEWINKSETMQGEYLVGVLLAEQQMKNLVACRKILCLDAQRNAQHWECWVATTRNIIGLFTIQAEGTERAQAHFDYLRSQEEIAAVAEMGRRTRQRLAEWLRQLDQEVVVGLRSGVEAEQRAALARLLRWGGREPREGDFERFVWCRKAAADALSGQLRRDAAGDGGRVGAAAPIGCAEEGAGCPAARRDPPVVRRAAWRACAAAGALLRAGAWIQVIRGVLPPAAAARDVVTLAAGGSGHRCAVGELWAPWDARGGGPCRCARPPRHPPRGRRVVPRSRASGHPVPSLARRVVAAPAVLHAGRVAAHEADAPPAAAAAIAAVGVAAAPAAAALAATARAAATLAVATPGALALGDAAAA